MSVKAPIIRGPMGAFGNVDMGGALIDRDADVDDKRVDYNQLQQQQQQQQQQRRKQPAKQAVGPPSEMLQLVGGLDGDYGDQQQQQQRPDDGYEEQQPQPPPKRRAVQQQQTTQRARAPTPDPLEDQYDDAVPPAEELADDVQPAVQMTSTQYFDVHVKTAKAQMIEMAEALATTQEVMRGLKNTFALLEKTPMGGRAVKQRPATSNGRARPAATQQQQHDF